MKNVQISHNCITIRISISIQFLREAPTATQLFNKYQKHSKFKNFFAIANFQLPQSHWARENVAQRQASSSYYQIQLPFTLLFSIFHGALSNPLKRKIEKEGSRARSGGWNFLNFFTRDYERKGRIFLGAVAAAITWKGGCNSSPNDALTM
jgi:hypothetical protein